MASDTFPSIFWVLRTFGTGEGGRRRKGQMSLYITGYSCGLLGWLSASLISFSMVLVRTVVAPTCQLERDSCPSSNLVH